MVDLALLQEKINERKACEIALHAALEQLEDEKKAFINAENARLEQLEDAKKAFANAENAILAVEGATPALLASLGVEMSGKPRKRGVAPAKWRHPDDDTKTWSGKGRRPGWANGVELAAI